MSPCCSMKMFATLTMCCSSFNWPLNCVSTKISLSDCLFACFLLGTCSCPFFEFSNYKVVWFTRSLVIPKQGDIYRVINLTERFDKWQCNAPLSVFLNLHPHQSVTTPQSLNSFLALLFVSWSIIWCFLLLSKVSLTSSPRAVLFLRKGASQSVSFISVK